MESDRTSVQQFFQYVRKQTRSLAEGLSAEDLCVQSMPDASPGKWHLGHTTWFFETFILQKYVSSYRCFDDKFNYLFNSYYDSVGRRHARPQRGFLTRPSLQEVYDYRDHVDIHMQKLLTTCTDEIAALVTIGLHHEMQHQELFLTDLLHLLSHNPLYPNVLKRSEASLEKHVDSKLKMVSFDGGLIEVGADESQDWQAFSYDCEQPRHQVFLTPFKLASRLVSNADWLEFMADGAYQDSLLWLSDGWSHKEKAQWQAPLYWQHIDGEWFHFGLDGLQPLDLCAPVSHVSYFEADAFARWSGKRLPREHEWECAAKDKVIRGNFLESYSWRPFSAVSPGEDFEDLYGDVWEWTQSTFSAYPGFRAKQGALGEYNGKFMINQQVLKGGSCVTPRLQMRESYRNFFYPHQRWQFMGLRLAEDI